jgi:hypothetical protein
MDFVQRVKCLFGKHHRSRRTARRLNGQYHAICSGCGKPMIKVRAGWKLADEPLSSKADGAEGVSPGMTR